MDTAVDGIVAGIISISNSSEMRQLMGTPLIVPHADTYAIAIFAGFGSTNLRFNGTDVTTAGQVIIATGVSKALELDHPIVVVVIKCDRANARADDVLTEVFDLLVALGASAGRAILGRAVTIARLRGQGIAMEDGSQFWVTVHPSYLLRLPDAEKRAEEQARFVEDLRLVGSML